MSKNDDSEKKIINSFTKMLIEISKMKSNSSNYKSDDNKKLVDAIYLYHNVHNFQPDILKTDKKFTQLYSTFLETILNFFPQLLISNQLIRAIARNFTWYAQSTGTLPHSDGYCYLICQILYNFPNISDDSEISYFFNTIFQIPIFISSFFYSTDIKFFVNLFFNQLKEIESIPFLITILHHKATFPNNSDSSSYSIIHQFAHEVENNKQSSESRISYSIKFISIYIEKLSPSYPNLINDLFHSNDFNIFYTYLVAHHKDDSFIQFIVSLLATGDNTTSPNESDKLHLTSPNRQVFNFLIQQFVVKNSTNPEIQLKLIQSLYFFITNYHVDVNSFEPKNFFVTLFNIPTHDDPDIKSLLLDFFDVLVNFNYEYSFIIFANYLNEYKRDCPFKRLSFILQHLITTFSFGNFNSNPNQNYYLQNLPFFFVESFGDSDESLGHFLSDYPIFQMLIVVLYQYNYSYVMNDPNPRATWMKKIVECSDYFDHSNILIQMLTVDPSGDLINKYISILKDHFSPSLFNVLTTTLHQSYFLVEQFLQFRGLQTIDKILPSLDDDMLTNLLVSISSHPFSDELNESILKLPNDHIFFHLRSNRCYYRILKNSPIRLPVFLPFVRAPPMTYSQFDLVNISKYAVPIYQRFNRRVPYVFNLINRHLTYRQASEILRNNPFFIDEKMKQQIGDMINSNADHFPIYEFLPNSQGVSVLLNVEITEKAKKSILFWFKVVSPIYQPFQLFHTEKKTLTIENDFLKIDSNFSIKIERNAWHSLVISNKAVKIDADRTFSFQDSSPINQFVFGQSNVDSLWVLSPNVRIIENISIDDFLRRGPQFLRQTEKNSIIPIPDESILVDYSGLPYYFTLPSFFKNEFLNVIENCRDSNQVIGLFLLLLNVMVVNDQIEKYWPFVLHLLSTKTKFLNNYFISYIINFISLHYSSKIFESFILNTNFWINLSDKLLGYTLNNLLSHSNNHTDTIFEFFTSLLLIEISNNSPSKSYSNSMDDSTIQIILFFLSRLSSQFQNESYLKQLIEIVLFSEKITFSITVRLFFIQTALQNDINLTSRSMPRNWILKLLSYFKGKSNDSTSDVTTFYLAVFNLLTHFSDNEIQSNFPQDSFDTTPFVYNYKYWHYFFSLLTGRPHHFSKSIIDGYSNDNATTIKIPSIIPSIVSLTFNGLAVLIQTNFNPYQNNGKEGLIENDKNTLKSVDFLKEYVRDSFKLLNQICERLPQLFHKDSICLSIQTICPLIPNLQSIFLPNVSLSQSEKFCVNMNDQQLILDETLETWKITNSFQKEIICMRPEISRFSLQSHSIIIPDKKCELFSKRISNLIQNNEFKFLNNISSFKHVFHYTNFTQFSVNLLFANSDRFLELVPYLFGFCPFAPHKLFDEYFKLPFQIFISQLNKENLNANLFEQILKFIIQGFQIDALYNVFSSSLSLLFMFLNNALGFISLDQNSNLFLNSNSNELNSISNSISSSDSHSNTQSADDLIIINNNNESSLINLVREMILLITKTGVQKMHNEIIQYLLDSKNIINNDVIFSSYHMVCQMISSLHVFYLSIASSSLPFLKVLQTIWPINDQSFKTFFTSNYSIEVYEAFQKAAVEADISYLSSILTNSSKAFLKLLAISNTDTTVSFQNNFGSEICQNFDLSKSFDLYSSHVYEIEKRELKTRAEFTYLETAIDCSASLKAVLYLKRCMTSHEKNITKYFSLESFTKQQQRIETAVSKSIFPFAWPFWISRVLSPSYDTIIDQGNNKFTILNDFKFESKIEFKLGTNIFMSKLNQKEVYSNNILDDYYSGNSIESVFNFYFITFSKLYLHKKFHAFNARFVKNDIDMSTSVFILENKILLLLNSSINDKVDRLIFNRFEADDKMTSLFKMISHFEFEKFSFFYSHPVLSIPLNSILSFFEDDHMSKNDKINSNSFVSLHIFSLKSPAFSLIASKKDLNILNNSIRPFIKSNFESFSSIQIYPNIEPSLSNNVYFKDLDPADVFQRFENHSIFPFEFFILLNALHGRFFDNFKNLPVFPRLENSSIRPKRGILQFQNAFQYYSPDFLEFTSKSDINQFNTYLNSDIVYVNVDNCDMVRLIFDNLTSLSSKSNVSLFLSTEFNEKLLKFTKSKTSLNIKNTANKIKKRMMKSWDNDSNTNENTIDTNDLSDDVNSSSQIPQPTSNLMPSNDIEFLNRIHNHLSTNIHLFDFRNSSSFRSFSSTTTSRRTSKTFFASNSTSNSSSSSSLPTSASSSCSFPFLRECVAVSRRGSFVAVDCPLRCCAEAFRVVYSEKNKERIVGTRHMSTFVYYEFVKKRMLVADGDGEKRDGGKAVVNDDIDDDISFNAGENRGNKDCGGSNDNNCDNEKGNDDDDEDEDTNINLGSNKDCRDDDANINNNGISDEDFSNDIKYENDNDNYENRDRTRNNSGILKSNKNRVADDKRLLFNDFNSCYSNPHTIINEHDFVAVTFWTHFAVIWDIIRGLPLQLIEFTSADDIIDGMFEENYGLIAFCTNQCFFIYTINGSFIMQSLIDNENSQIKRIISFEGFKIEYITNQVSKKTQSVYLFMNENK